MDKFTNIPYIRPDYESIKKRMSERKAQIEKAASYQELRDHWLSVKHEIEDMEYMEQMAHIPHLCGIDVQKNGQEMAIQNKEDPIIYSLRDNCDQLVASSVYADKIREEFGEACMKRVDSQRVTAPEAASLQSKEYTLRTKYRSLRTTSDAHEEELYSIFHELIELRPHLAQCFGYKNYPEMAYNILGRTDYGEKELKCFRKQVKELVTPVCREYKAYEYQYPKSDINTGNDLIKVLHNIYLSISEETREYIDQMVNGGFYDLENRPDKSDLTITCCMIPRIKMPFVIGNVTGNSSDACNITHEFGHGFAFYTAARTQKLYEYHRSSASINELHAKTMEHFAYPYIESFAGKYRKEYIRAHICHQLSNLPYRCAIDEFEHEIYRQPGLSRTGLCELWVEIVQVYMPWIAPDIDGIKQGTYWPHQTHIVLSPFYYIEYNIAQISTYDFYRKMKADYQSAWKDYVSLCKAGGSKSYFDLLKTAHLANPFQNGEIADILSPVMLELGT